MGNVVNFELLSQPVNWVIVFLTLYFLALMSKYISDQLSGVGVSLL